MKVDLKDFSNIVYIDPNINDYGILLDGKTPETAYKEVPTLEDNTCYVVRRYDDYAAQFKNASSAVKNIMLLGMPRPGEKYFEFMSPEIQTAWGNDEGRIGCFKFDKTSTTTPADENWTSTAKHHCILTALEYMRIENCRLMRTSASKYTSGRGVGFMFVINSASAATIKLENVEFGYEFERMDSYHQNNNSLTSEQIQKFSHYINCNDIRNFSMVNCYADCACVSDTNDGSGSGSTDYLTDFAVRTYVTHLFIKDCTFYTFGRVNNNTATGNSYNSAVFWIAQSPECYIQNIEYNLLYNQNQINGCNRDLIQFEETDRGNNLYIENIKFSQKLFQDYDKEYSSPLHSGIALSGYYGSLYINNLEFNYDNEIVKSYAGYCLYLSGIPKTMTGLSKILIKNIKIRFYVEDYSKFDNSASALYVAQSKPYTATQEGIYNDIINNSSTYLIPTIENIDIKANCTALYIDRTNVLSGKIEGFVNVNSYSYLNLESLKQFCNNYAIKSPTNGGNIIKIKNLYMGELIPEGNIVVSPDNTQSSSNFGNNTILIENCNRMPFNTSIVSDTSLTCRNTCICCYNYEDGKMFIKNPRNYVTSSGITRNNQQSKSVLQVVADKNDIQSNTYLYVGKPYLMPGFKTKLASGLYDITYYINTYNIDLSKSSINFNLLVSYNDDYLYYSSISGDIYEDDSVWSDPNGKSYKIVLRNVNVPIDLSGKVVEREIITNILQYFYSNSGYMYIDTIPEVTKVGEGTGIIIKPELM